MDEDPTNPQRWKDPAYWEGLAQTAYEAYCHSTGGKTWDGRQTPEWAHICEKTPHVKAAWIASVKATVKSLNVRDSVTNEPYVEDSNMPDPLNIPIAIENFYNLRQSRAAEAKAKAAHSPSNNAYYIDFARASYELEASKGNTGYPGFPMPSWEGLPPDMQAAWVNAARAFFNKLGKSAEQGTTYIGE